jgi:hypothetical protein
MHHIVICGLPRSTIFFHISHKRHDLKKTLLNTKCVFWFSLLIFSEKFFILRRLKRDIIKNVYQSSCKISIILVPYYWNLDFLDRFSKTLNYQISWKSVRWQTSFPMRTDVRTDRYDKANSRFSEFYESSFLPVKIWKIWRSNLQRENLDIAKNQILYS